MRKNLATHWKNKNLHKDKLQNKRKICFWIKERTSLFKDVEGAMIKLQREMQPLNFTDGLNSRNLISVSIIQSFLVDTLENLIA